MRGGFTFCGVDIADIGIEYAPEIEDTYVYKPAKANVHEETFDGHDGGYIYGAYAEPKEFILRCFFEDRIDKGLLARVFHLFRVGKSGKLVFQRRPWCYYYATVTEVDDSEMATYLSGLITIKMKAYYPFARSDSFTSLRTDQDHLEVMQNTALFDKESMVPQRIFSDLNNLGSKTILLANPGTEPAAVSISIAGDVGSGIRIKNETNGQMCGYVGITKADTTNVYRYVYTDGISGKTILTGPGYQKLAFLYHESGFITLEPGFPATREIFAHYYDKTVKVTNRLYDDYVGQYIFVDGDWHEILTQPDNQTLMIKENVSSGSEQTTIMPMNKITIFSTHNETFSLSNLEFHYKPTFS